MTCSNNCSLVALISPKGWRSGFKYLVTGDTETQRWDRLTKIFKSNLGCDVMAAPHHGADSGFHPDLLRHASPKQILISAGVRNQFGHPDRAAHTQYGAAAEVFSTHRGDSFVTRTGFFSPNTSIWQG
jgi:beta-lactamase superfamily II metal-dependent hydrolase